MYRLVFAIIAVLTLSNTLYAQDAPKPTIVLVHGAFADGSSWNGVIEKLSKDGYRTVAAANPLRGVKTDADYIGALISSLKTPVVLVGHSYGGSVISEAAVGHDNVKSLVYVAAFAPEEGESAATLSAKFPGSTLAPTLAPPVDLAGGGSDLYIEQKAFPKQFAHDVPAKAASLMAATQRPITKAALEEVSSSGAWKTVPSWFIYGDGDKNIPPQVQKFMADRAKAKATVVIAGASHVVMVSHPKAVAELIERAAK